MEPSSLKNTSSQKRKKKIEKIQPVQPQETTDTDIKKRGRKPKGGKLIVKTQHESTFVNPVVNIIMHLKCSLKDVHTEKKDFVVKDPLSYDPSVPPEIKTYNEILPTTTNQFAVYNEKEETNIAYREPICKKCNTAIALTENAVAVTEEVDTEYADIHMKDIHHKLKQLRAQYCKHYPVDKKSACFWCTYDFDNPACFIPKYDMNNTIFGYGSF
jgi:hypothetical protein